MSWNQTTDNKCHPTMLRSQVRERSRSRDIWGCWLQQAPIFRRACKPFFLIYLRSPPCCMFRFVGRNLVVFRLRILLSQVPSCDQPFSFSSFSTSMTSLYTAFHRLWLYEIVSLINPLCLAELVWKCRLVQTVTVLGNAWLIMRRVYLTSHLYSRQAFPQSRKE